MYLKKLHYKSGINKMDKYIMLNKMITFYQYQFFISESGVYELPKLNILTGSTIIVGNYTN